MRNRGIFLAALAVLLVFSLSPLTADPVIRHGIDSFTTVASGTTYYDFSKNPIPAGFFCKSSAPFTGRVVLKGLPLETGAPGSLHGADTVIERLDDATFDANGSAVTRIQFRALSLVSVAPVKTSCGSFHVYVTLAGKQRETTMRIYRTDENGGHFVAPLAVNARMSFISVKPTKSARRLELTGSFTFPASPIPWSTTGGAVTKRLGTVLVDTDGDLRPDTLLTGSSNFWPGWSPNAIATKGCTTCEPYSCHTDPTTQKQHCTGPVTVCAPAACP
ncbi:MAG TPA: hypothetical protein VF173_24235 [Thermoanaerobaculia bacterium]|nr:hypothetical protein [Thermoanaerobaculia bacterium]